MRLLPRLDTSAALSTLREMNGALAVELQSAEIRLSHPSQHWFPLGGRVASEELRALRRTLDGLAMEHGFPADLSVQREGMGSQAGWDRALGRALVDHLERMGAAELDHPDTWTWLGTTLLPHLIVWRWGWPHDPEELEAPRRRRRYERYIGTLRSGLRRPWYRTVMYAEDGHEYPDLNEDHLVQIEERPSLGAEPEVGRALLQGIVRAYAEGVLDPERQSAGQREEAVRQAARWLVAENVVMPLGLLEPSQLKDRMQQAVGEALQAQEESS